LASSQRKPAEGNRILADLGLDVAATAIYCSDFPKASKLGLMSALYNTMITDELYMQCCLHTLLSVARHFVELDPRLFVSLAQHMNRTSAREIAFRFLAHRTEAAYTGTILDYWDEDPVTLRRALENVFSLFSNLYLTSPLVTVALRGIATRAYNLASSLPSWSVEQNTFFWEKTLTQTSHVFMASNRTFFTPDAIATALDAIPDFVADTAAWAKLMEFRLGLDRLTVGGV
jgi:hypothetical protein